MIKVRGNSNNAAAFQSLLRARTLEDDGGLDEVDLDNDEQSSISTDFNNKT